MVADEPELGQEGAGFGNRHASGVDERPHEGHGTVELRPHLLDLGDHDPAPEAGRPARRRLPAEDHVDQRRLARPVAADQRHPIAVLDQQVDRPEPELGALHRDPGQSRDEVATASGVGHLESQLPRLARLVDDGETVDRALRLGRLAGQLLGLVGTEAADVLVGLVARRSA